MSTDRSHPKIRTGLASAREAQKPVPQASAMKELSPIWILVSMIPIFLLGGVALIGLWLEKKRKAMEARRLDFCRKIGLGDGQRPIIVGFWHPYCNAGGGGERVLWTAIYWCLRKQLAEENKKSVDSRRKVICVVYSGDYPTTSKEAILQRVEDRFKLPLAETQYSKSIHFLPLPSRYLISDTYWKRFTLLAQSLGSISVAAEGVGLGESTDSFWPDVYIDTMGHPFTLPLISFLSGAQTTLGAYVHYPVISTDMIDRIRNGISGVESGSAPTLKGWKRIAKLIYYQSFTRLYAISLLYADEVMTNSTWTNNHITRLLNLGRSTYLAAILNVDGFHAKNLNKDDKPPGCRTVYPPCDTREFLHLPLKGRDQTKTIISLAQFRPEKDQAKQLEALAGLFKTYPQWNSEGVKLILMGSCRDEADEGRVEGLKLMARELGVAEQVEFVVNASFSEIVTRLGQASIGLHTMRDEHFGISVVEFMAAGLIPIGHASAGPYLDIITPFQGQITGYLATEASEFTEQIHKALSLSSKQQIAIRTAARKQATTMFSQECFEMGWKSSWDRLLESAEQKLHDVETSEKEKDKDR